MHARLAQSDNQPECFKESRVSIKKIIFLYVFVLSVANIQATSDCCRDDCEATSRTYLSVNPDFLPASPMRVAAFRDAQVDARCEGYHAAMQVVLFGSHSLDSDLTARYFSPYCAEPIIVDEQVAVEDKNLLAQQFNIFTKEGTFRSQIALEPEHAVAGIGFEYRHGFWRCKKRNRGMWIGLAVPIIFVRTTMGLKEHVIDDGGGVDASVDPFAVANMKEALNQPEWKFGKIACGSMSKTSFADVELRVGFEWLQHCPYHLESYIGLLIPTANDPNGDFLFEPIVGNGGHLGFLLGSASGFVIWDKDDIDLHLRMEIANHLQYLFTKTQRRSIDLKHKPWSRYMEMYVDKEQAALAASLNSQNLATPGINVLTREVNVQPGISNTFNTAGVITGHGVHLEGGYNFFARSADSVHLSNPWQEGPALKSYFGQGTTNPVRNMSGNRLLEQISVPLTEYDSSLIQENDLDLQSATHPCTLIQSLYATAAYNWDDFEHPIFLSIGGAYTFTRSDQATQVLKRITAWGKFGVSF
jgi:hypothetical protein